MVSVLTSRFSGPSSSPGQGHCYVLGQDTLLLQCLSPLGCIYIGVSEFNVSIQL